MAAVVAGAARIVDPIAGPIAAPAAEVGIGRVVDQAGVRIEAPVADLIAVRIVDLAAVGNALQDARQGLHHDLQDHRHPSRSFSTSTAL